MGVCCSRTEEDGCSKMAEGPAVRCRVHLFDLPNPACQRIAEFALHSALARTCNRMRSAMVGCHAKWSSDSVPSPDTMPDLVVASLDHYNQGSIEDGEWLYELPPSQADYEKLDCLQSLDGAVNLRSLSLMLELGPDICPHPQKKDIQANLAVLQQLPSLSRISLLAPFGFVVQCGIVESLVGITSLRHLKLTSLPRSITNDICLALAKHCTALESLQLHMPCHKVKCTSVAALHQLTALRSLILLVLVDANDPMDLAPLGDLHCLRHLALLFQRTPRLTLCDEKVRLTENGHVWINRFSSLTSLSLQGIPLPAPLTIALQKLCLVLKTEQGASKFQSNSLTHASITLPGCDAALLASLAKCTNLQQLHLKMSFADGLISGENSSCSGSSLSTDSSPIEPSSKFTQSLAQVLAQPSLRRVVLDNWSSPPPSRLFQMLPPNLLSFTFRPVGLGHKSYSLPSTLRNLTAVEHLCLDLSGVQVELGQLAQLARRSSTLTTLSLFCSANSNVRSLLPIAASTSLRGFFIGLDEPVRTNGERRKLHAKLHTTLQTLRTKLPFLRWEVANCLQMPNWRPDWRRSDDTGLWSWS
eukprot:NODE_186_length_2265_cov_74.277978_g126_i0.p1 GENE.NODE_186_length_2265_cov_74.277978_g126_i0~~NODE_186_length_2265_cov_74.277978_g126_i0.p1  ORF type:complete len:587 (-),score=82.93 NODE_186_length_2265_cov_74.277978_g126_i0:438-2198(-)